MRETTDPAPSHEANLVIDLMPLTSNSPFEAGWTSWEPEADLYSFINIKNNIWRSITPLSYYVDRNIGPTCFFRGQSYTVSCHLAAVSSTDPAAAWKHIKRTDHLVLFRVLKYFFLTGKRTPGWHILRLSVSCVDQCGKLPLCCRQGRNLLP